MSADRPRTALPQGLQPLTADDPSEVGGYRLYARLGAGGMGRVYLSYTRGGRPVALKVVRPELAEDPEFRRRFAQEVASAQLIHGLYTAQVVDAGVDAAVPWLATAYVAGPSLQQVVQQYGPLPERTVLLLVAGIAEALQAIHAVGVVHRDLKPANVLLAADGPRVIDFGIARAADAVSLTGAGLRIGSPGFMAPEQALGLPATPATDLFALGALAVYVAGGVPPFGQGPEAAALYRVVHAEPDLSRVPAGVAELVHHCLAKQPEDRPNTAQLIDAVHRHPALGGQLRFTDDWLPLHVNTAIVRHGELPGTPAQGYTVQDSVPSPHEALTALTPVGPAAPTAPAPVPTTPAPAPAAPPAPVTTPAPVPATAAPSRSARDGGRGSRRRTAAIAVTALLLGAVGSAAVLLDDPDLEYAADSAPIATATAPASPTRTPTPTATPVLPTPAPPTATAPAAAPGYTTVYAGVEAVSPDHGYEFDLKTGKVVAEETATWFVARTATGFLLAENNTAHIADNGRPGIADCLTGLANRPATSLDFAALNGRSFCVRGQDSRDLAVVRVLSVSPGDGPVKVSLDYYRRG
ncbi:serine/threonine-protein kinase [Kitasatospora sp. NPDC097643]|uniref:serine/threonine-protein kinase n=1 Tax=Kitasatospora sp. NPDC097643 TaxID=3157230 RepID=UPI0033345F82